VRAASQATPSGGMHSTRGHALFSAEGIISALLGTRMFLRGKDLGLQKGLIQLSLRTVADK
jgi:hypothetical protein